MSFFFLFRDKNVFPVLCGQLTIPFVLIDRLIALPHPMVKYIQICLLFFGTCGWDRRSLIMSPLTVTLKYKKHLGYV